ncbi:hypothetical protein [Microvirga sp. M2]|uniref:hypothetical protein n=1 Tax=Microvirga sp. M2 TaxID=3073270 RepID=UPI0039C386D0
MKNLELFTVLSGIRIQVLARSLTCKTAFARDLHERLAQQLAYICKKLRLEIAVTTRFGEDGDDMTGWEGPEQIDLLDTLYIDHGTQKYQVNGEAWYSMDGDGAPIVSPATNEQTEGLGRFIDELAEYGIAVTAHHVFIACDEQLAA